MKLARSRVKSWKEIHKFYTTEADHYDEDKLIHALSIYHQVNGIGSKLKEEQLTKMFTDAIDTRQWMTEGIKKSREKDYDNPYRQMVYESEEEMNKVVGSLSENGFIKQENEKFQQFKRKVNKLLKRTEIKPTPKKQLSGGNGHLINGNGHDVAAVKKSPDAHNKGQGKIIVHHSLTTIATVLLRTIPFDAIK
jgi:hypothetical protein